MGQLADRRGRTTAVLGLWCAMVVLLTWSLGGVSAFNMDVDSMVRYWGQSENSMFGFTVALHKERDRSWVLVGAPEAQSRAQRRVRRGGAVYRCLISPDGTCYEVQFDRSEGNNVNGTNHDMDNKSHQWFGATLQSSLGGSAVVACAPRYVYYPNTREEIHEPVGTCWVARRDFTETEEYSPCRTSEWGYHRQGYCQAGFSAAIDEDGDRLFIGAPGSRYWQGQVYSLDATVFMPFLPPEQIQVDSLTGQVFTQNLHQRPDLFSTGEQPPAFDDTYLGYSIAVGYFSEDSDTSVAVGRPKGNDLKGKVEIYTWNLTRESEISGEQLGSYFGYSICACDVDNDGIDDIIVGAPLYTEQNNEGKYETGQIYVFYNDRQKPYDTRKGFNSRSRFGLAVSSLGDINRDGHGDIAVGAPYDNPDGRGAVYIYLGSETGLMEKPSQIIRAKDVSPRITTFGFSLHGGLDLDDNQYPDMVVGAYESNLAAFFRARPIVTVNASVEFTVADKSITLENTTCVLEDGTRTICTSVRTCMSYGGLGVDNRQNFTYELVLDAAKAREQRILFRNTYLRAPQSSRNITLNLAKGVENCREFPVYLKPSIRDKLTPLVVEMRYGLVNIPAHRRVARLAPIMDLSKEPVKKDLLNIFKNCGKDQVCIPDLWLTVTPSVEKYLLGSKEELNLTVLVNNKGEDAFEAVYNLKIPLGLRYMNIRRLDRNNDVTVQCSAPSVESNNTLKCDIGNPLPGGKHVQFVVLMQPYHAEGLKSPYSFTMNVNSTNPEKRNPRKKMIQTLNVTVDVQYDLTLTGISNPSEVFWSSAEYSKDKDFTHESEIGPQVVHEHTVRNKGPADIIAGKVYFDIPTSVFANDKVLYLLEEPLIEGPLRCQFPSGVRPNALGLKMQQKKSYSDSNVDLTESSSSHSSSSSSSSFSSSSSQSSGSASSGETAHGQGYAGSRGGSRSQSGGSQGGNRGGSTRYPDEDAPSEGGRRGGSHTHHLVGTEERRPLHRDEGLETSSSDGYGSIDSTHTSHSSGHSYRNRSESSRRVESHSGGEGGPYVHSSSNYSVSWTEDGRPVYHYRNYTDGNTTIVESSQGHHNGRGQESSIDDGNEHEREEDSHYSSGSAGSSGRAGGGYYDSAGGRQESNSSRGGFTHYSTSWSSSGGSRHHGGHGTQWSSSSDSYSRDNVDDNRHSAGGQYGNLDHRTRVRTHHYNEEEEGEEHGRGESSYRRENEQDNVNTRVHYGSSSQDRGRSGYGQGSQTEHSHTRTSSWNEEQRQGSGRAGSRHYNAGDRDQGYSEQDSRGGTQFYTSSVLIGNDGNQDLGYAARGHYGNEGTRHRSSSSAYRGRDPDLDDAGARLNNGDDNQSLQEGKNLTLYNRFRRQVDDSEDIPPQLKECNATNCLRIACDLDRLSKGQEARVVFRMRVWVPTMKKLWENRVIKTSSQMAVLVTKVPYIGQPAQTEFRTHEVFTDIHSTDSPTTPDIIPLWVVVLSAVAGTMILLLVIFILYKFGFFKRNRPSDAAEKEPLNRNGHYSAGDEAL